MFSNAQQRGDKIKTFSMVPLARRMEVSRPYITKVLRQDVNFSFRTAAKLAAALKMDFFPELRPKDENAPAEDAQKADFGGEDC